MVYETGMQIIYDTVSKMAVVVFRDKLSFHGPFDTRAAAYEAGEAHCRDNGWNLQQISSGQARLVLAE